MSTIWTVFRDQLTTATVISMQVDGKLKLGTGNIQGLMDVNEDMHVAHAIHFASNGN